MLFVLFLPVHHLFQPRFHPWPSGVQNTVEDRMANPSIRQDHMIAQHTFFHGNNALDGPL
jgi:hypothetical protein